MIITVTLNPAVDKTAEVQEIHVNGLNRLENIVTHAGGKGINVSKTLKYLNTESVATGFIAGSNGTFITTVLDELGIRHDFTNTNGNTRVNLKVLDKDMNLTELNEVGPTISSEEMTELMSKVSNLITQGDVVVLSGSAPKGVPSAIYYVIGEMCKNKGAKVVLDADKDLFHEGVQGIPTLIKPNKYELYQYFEITSEISDKELIEKTRVFIERGIEYVAISMGSQGAYFLSKDKTYKVEGLKVKAHSSVGAGDAMVAALTLGLEQKMSFEEMIRLAVATSAGAVETKGTAPAKINRIEELKKQVKIEEIN